jgi:hypothetical protein
MNFDWAEDWPCFVAGLLILLEFGAFYWFIIQLHS